jgi:hypothetical protein
MLLAYTRELEPRSLVHAASLFSRACVVFVGDVTLSILFPSDSMSDLLLVSWAFGQVTRKSWQPPIDGRNENCTYLIIITKENKSLQTVE